MEPAHTGLLEAIMSQFNVAGLQINPISSDGTYKEIEIIGFPEIPDTAVQDGPATNFCAPANEPTTFSNKYTTDEYKYIQFEINEVRFREVCFDSPPEILANLIMKHLNAIKVAVEKDVITKLAANAGLFYDKSATKVWEPVAGTTPKQPDVVATMEALSEYERVGCNRMPLTVGDGDLNVYMKTQDVACCNQYGIDTSGADMFAFFKSRYVDTVIGSPNQYFMMAPGTVQMAVWNANVGTFAYTDARDEAGVIVDPMTGMVFDLDRIWDPCTKKWTITLGLNYTVVFFDTSELYPVGHELNGTNGILHFNAPPGP